MNYATMLYDVSLYILSLMEMVLIQTNVKWIYDILSYMELHVICAIVWLTVVNVT
jgi:hypothetical protein